VSAEGGGGSRDARGARPLVALAVASLAAVATLLYAAARWQDNDASWRVQGVGLAAAALLVAALAMPFHRAGAVSPGAWSGRRTALLVGAGLLLAATGLRYAELRVLPYSDQALFEELKKGGGGQLLGQGGPLPIEFRYTKVLCALGLSRSGDRLESLRFPFRINGCLSLLFLVLCLRALGADRAATAFVTVTAATLPWLVVGGGVADESFAGLAPSLALVWAIAECERSAARAAAWAAAAGLLGGVLLYEYVSFQASIVFAGSWLALRAAVPRKPGTPWRWLPLAAFTVAFLLVAAPALANMLHAPTDSALLEGLFRHRAGRAAPIVGDVAANLKGYARTLLGLPCDSTECFAVFRQPMIPAALGFLFAAALLSALALPRQPLERGLALLVVASVVIAAALANNFNPQRVTASLSLLVVLSGTALTRAIEWVRPRLRAPIPEVATLGAAAAFAVAGLQAVHEMAASEPARDCWVNNDYVMCRHIADTARPGQRVLVQTPQYPHFDWSHPDVTWVFAGKNLDVSGANGMDLERTPPAPGTLVVVGYRSGTVSDDDLRSLLAVAGETRGASSLTVSRNVAGRAAAASVCVRCR